jgi:hypothetical protein
LVSNIISALLMDILRPMILVFAQCNRADLFARVRDLADRESECCSFFTFDVTAGDGGGVTLAVKVDAAHIAVLDAIMMMMMASKRRRDWMFALRSEAGPDACTHRTGPFC